MTKVLTLNNSVKKNEENSDNSSLLSLTFAFATTHASTIQLFLTLTNKI